MFTKTLITTLMAIGFSSVGTGMAATHTSQANRFEATAVAQGHVQLAREAESRGRGRGRDDAKGHGNADESTWDQSIQARESTEAPRGQDNERAGDRQRRNRGGRNG